MKNAGYEVEAKYLSELVNVAVVGWGSSDYTEKLRGSYLSKSIGRSVSHNSRTIDASDPEAGRIIASIFNQKSKLMGHHGRQ